MPSSSKNALFAGLALMLAGCPAGQVSTGTTALTLKALAVTAQDTSCNEWIPAVYLSWNEVPGAAKYELNLQGTTTPLSGCDKLACVHAKVNEGNSYTYTVRALDSAGAQKIASSPISLTVIKHSILAPAGAPAVTPSDGGLISSTTPTITWAEVTGASGYFVKVSLSNTDTVVFSALTTSPTVDVGKIPDKTMTFPQFDQKGDGVSLSGGKTYDFSVQALATTAKSLAEATAVDVSAAVNASLKVK
ncbi:MAG: hypothetical protein FJZ01_14380 [Candidatus Sericytochromatia bacterium]|nr:hypothetical protein [Candidatus Tanganyikabacteria bacterium]